MSEKHSCKALVVHCIDFRFVASKRDFLLANGYADKYDLLTVPGAAKNINRMEEWIELAMKLHQPEEILIFDHEDCGGYRADNSFATHRTHLLQAKTDLGNKYPQVKTKTYMSFFAGIKEVN